MAAELDWRQVSILRAIGRYLRQGGATYSQTYIAHALTANVDLARQLVVLFDTKFDPERRGSLKDRKEEVEDLRDKIKVGLDDVASLDHDRIIRSYLAVMDAIVRTNVYQSGRETVAFKLLPRKIPDLPEPRPAYEIFVYSPRVEGVHLRFGAVARGGLRWSDRAEDFRTEILGLVKAQMVKNTVIVPVGAKGGFYAKRLPDPSSDREAWLAEGVACYRLFISSLLDVTDNIVDGRRRAAAPTWSATTATTRTWWSPPTRAPRPSPTSPTRISVGGGLLARRRLRLGRLGRLRPQGDGHHRPRRLAVGDPALPGDGHRPPDRRLHLRRRSAT